MAPRTPLGRILEFSVGVWDVCPCPVTGYSEELLAVDKKHMSVGTFVLIRKLGRAPKSLLAGDLRRFL